MQRYYQDQEKGISASQEIIRRTAFHEAGHAAAIFLENQRKNLPSIYFYIDIHNHNQLTSPALTRICGGRQIDDVLMIGRAAAVGRQDLSTIADYQVAYEADIINLLAGPLAEAKYVFLRDNKLIEQLESQVNTKKYELGLWWWWYDQIIPENRAIMQAIIQKYIDKWLLVPYSQLHPGVSYNNVTSLLTQVLSSAKSFLYFGATTGFDAMTRWGSDQGIFIGFTTGAIATVQRDYNCARWTNNICSSELKKLKDGRSKLRKSLSVWSSDTKKTFKDAVTRLWQIFSPNTQDAAYTARENDLLRSMYGSTQISKGTLADSLKKSWAGIKKSWAEVGQQVAGVVSDVTAFRNFSKDLKGTVQDIPTLPDSPADTSATTDISKSIDSYVYDVFASQKTALDLVGMSEVKDITPAFEVLGKQISVIKNDIIGGKDKQDSLISTLWASCELQCGGWWLCR